MKSAIAVRKTDTALARVRTELGKVEFPKALAKKNTFMTLTQGLAVRDKKQRSKNSETNQARMLRIVHVP